jgi:DNA primase
MKIPETTIQEIAQRIDTLSLVSEYIQLKKKGTRYWGLCPFHSEKSPSFTVTPEKGMYYCFGCHKGGNIYSFIMEVEKLSFIEAVKFLAKKANVEIEFTSDDRSREKRESLIDLYNRLSGSFHHLLVNDSRGSQARAYLEKRCISRETIEAFSIGYVPGGRDWLLGLLKKKNYSDEFIASSGLFVHKEGRLIPYFYDRLMFPIRKVGGDVIAFGGRTLREGPPKYINSPETLIFKKGDNLFGIDKAIDSIKKNRFFYIVEGYIDVLAMHQVGVTETVAPLGTALTENQARLLKRHAQVGTLVFDGDAAGIKAALKGIEILEKEGIEQEVIEPPDGDDPADILQKYGKERLNNLVKYHINGFQYLLTKALTQFDVNTPKGKEDIFRFLFSYLEKINSEIKREGYFSHIAEMLGIDAESVRKEYHKKPGSLSKMNRSEEPVGEEIKDITDELFLVLALAAHGEHYGQVRASITPDMFTDTRAKHIFIAIEECFREEKESLDSLLEKIDDKDICNLIVKKISSHEFAINTDKIIDDGMAILRRRNLEKRREEVLLNIRKSEKNEPWKVHDLLVEQMILDKEIEELRMNEDVRDRK